MTQSPNLQLPYLMPSQAQKHVTHNEALRLVDSILQLSVAAAGEVVPPADPAEGTRFIVGAAPTGAWAGQAGNIAVFQDGGWTFLVPRTGWLAWDAASGTLLVRAGGEWLPAWTPGTLPVSVGALGVNAEADAANRLVVCADSSLFDHDGEGHRVKLNKAAPSETASQLFQTGYSGRAELGLSGADDFSIKVSDDGASWREALRVDRVSGQVTLPATAMFAAPNLLVNGDFQVNQRGFGGGALAAGQYGPDRIKAGASGSSHTRTDFRVAHASGRLVQLVEPALWGLASFVGIPLVFSVEDLEGGALAVEIGAVSATLQPGAGRCAVAVENVTADGSPLAVSWGPAAGAVAYGRVKLEAGKVATHWQARNREEEMRLCQRYYANNFAKGVQPANGATSVNLAGFAPAADVINSQRAALPGRMRAAASINLFASSVLGSPPAGSWQWWQPGVGWQHASATGVQESNDRDFAVQLIATGAVSASAYIITGGWSADAEL